MQDKTLHCRPCNLFSLMLFSFKFLHRQYSSLHIVYINKCKEWWEIRLAYIAPTYCAKLIRAFCSFAQVLKQPSQQYKHNNRLFVITKMQRFSYFRTRSFPNI